MGIRDIIGRGIRRACYVVSLSAAFVSVAHSQTAKIVGLGATRCTEVIADVRRDPAVRRDYLAWAQGYMSGLIVTRPAGVDEALDLLPPTFRLGNQLTFLLDFCTENPTSGFSDAAETLYERLRRENSIK